MFPFIKLRHHHQSFFASVFWFVWDAETYYINICTVKNLFPELLTDNKFLKKMEIQVQVKAFTVYNIIIMYTILEGGERIDSAPQHGLGSANFA